MNQLNLIIFDMETSGLDPKVNECIQLAGKAYDARTLEPFPVEHGGEFNSMLKPLHFENIQEEALKVNKITREELEKAPDQGLVWNQFVDWVAKFNPKKSKWTAPIAAGKNIRDFDLKFVAVLNQLHCKKKEKTVLFSRMQVDLEDLIFAWFENEPEPANWKMDTLREYFGLSGEQGHTAICDVRQTGELIMKFLKLHRDLQTRNGANGKLIKFKGAFNKKAA